jgi:mannose-6-phosphate isomerase-like protein (cupin superfamily)
MKRKTARTRRRERTPKVANVRHATAFFKVLQTTRKSQTATMTLGPGQESGPKSNEHPGSDQVLLVMKGKLASEVGEARHLLKRGDVVVVPAGVPHRFVNRGKGPAVTFNVYTPPAYDPDEEE